MTVSMYIVFGLVLLGISHISVSNSLRILEHYSLVKREFQRKLETLMKIIFFFFLTVCIFFEIFSNLWKLCYFIVKSMYFQKIRQNTEEIHTQETLSDF